MNKNLSLALEKAVEKINPKGNSPLYIEEKGRKKPDLFSLSSNTELFQNDKGITIKIDRSKWNTCNIDFFRISKKNPY